MITRRVLVDPSPNPSRGGIDDRKAGVVPLLREATHIEEEEAKDSFVRNDEQSVSSRLVDDWQSMNAMLVQLLNCFKETRLWMEVDDRTRVLNEHIFNSQQQPINTFNTFHTNCSLMFQKPTKALADNNILH